MQSFVESVAASRVIPDLEANVETAEFLFGTLSAPALTTEVATVGIVALMLL